MPASNRRDDELSRARADRLELTRLRARIADAQHDRARVAAQLGAAEAAHAYRADDHDTLVTGIGAWLRSLVASEPDCTEAQQELAASELLCKELQEELAACDAYLRQLGERADKLAHAEARYADVLSQIERDAQADTTLTDELDEIAITEAELGASRFEIREAIELAIHVQAATDYVTISVREFSPASSREDQVLIGVGEALTGSAAERYSELCAALARAHHGLRMLDQLCGRLTSLLPGSFEIAIAPLPSTSSMVFRNLVGATGPLEALLPDLARVSSMIVSAVGELREREAKLDRALVECREMRARLLERYAMRVK
jgi:hypothetical protein